MEMPMDVLNKRLGQIRDNGDIDFDNTAAAIDIDSELQEKFLFFPMEEIEAVEIEEDRGQLHAGAGPEHCVAGPDENPNWLYNHAMNALALWWRLKNDQEKAEQEKAEQEQLEAAKVARRPEPGVYQGRNVAGRYFTTIVTDDRRVMVQQASGGLTDNTSMWDQDPWLVRRVDITDGTISA
jgi:hypothetical protein